MAQREIKQTRRQITLKRKMQNQQCKKKQNNSNLKGNYNKNNTIIINGNITNRKKFYKKRENEDELPEENQ